MRFIRIQQFESANDGWIEMEQTQESVQTVKKMLTPEEERRKYRIQGLFATHEYELVCGKWFNSSISCFSRRILDICRWRWCIGRIRSNTDDSQKTRCKTLRKCYDRNDSSDGGRTQAGIACTCLGHTLCRPWNGNILLRRVEIIGSDKCKNELNLVNDLLCDV